MKNVKKPWYRIAGVLLCMMLCIELCISSSVLCVHAEETDEDSRFLPPKKVASVVYDDSTSMRAFGGKLLDNWATANYAMQSLTALLNTSDELYITTMSDYKHSKKVDLANKSSAIQEIRSKVEWADGTYLEAVAVAMQRLKTQAKKETDENTQYWLVIVTDGAMETYQGKDLQTLLNEYTGYTFPNGSQLYIKYMSIGTEAVKIEDDVENGLQSCPAGDDIVNTLNGIAKNVSGCFEFGEESNSYIEFIDKRTVRLHSDIPLYHLSLFSQNSNASVESAILNDDHTMQISESIYMEVTDPKKAGNNRKNFVDAKTKTLKGYETKINLKQELIPEGDYTITFSEDISEHDFVAMYQPAIGLNLIVTEDGKEIVPENLREDDTLEVELQAINPISGELLSVESLPEDVTWEISALMDGEEVGSKQFAASDELKWKTDKIPAGNLTIKGTMYVPDYAPTNAYEHLEVQEPRAVEIQEIEMTGGKEAVYERAHLGKKACKTPLTFQLMDQGIPMSAADIQDEGIEKSDISLDVEVEGIQEGFWKNFVYGGWKQSNTGMTIQEDGVIVVYPDSIANFAPFAIKSGDYQVTLSLDSRKNCTGTGTYRIYGHWTDWMYVIVILLVLLLIFYILWVITKVRFQNQIVYRSIWRASGTGGGGTMVRAEERKKLPPICSSLFAPFFFSRDVTQSVFGLELIAMPAKKVKIRAKSLENYDGYQKGGSEKNPQENFLGIMKGSFRKYERKNRARNADIIVPADGIFLKSGDRLIWIRVERANGGMPLRNRRNNPRRNRGAAGNRSNRGNHAGSSTGNRRSVGGRTGSPAGGRSSAGNRAGSPAGGRSNTRGRAGSPAGGRSRTEGRMGSQTGNRMTRGSSSTSRRSSSTSAGRSSSTAGGRRAPRKR